MGEFIGKTNTQNNKILNMVLKNSSNNDQDEQSDVVEDDVIIKGTHYLVKRLDGSWRKFSLV